MQFHRRSIRLPEYDYASYGWYFVTICAQDRELYFENKNINKLIDFYWRNLKNKFENIDLDEYVIMPNHLHGIIVINNSVGATLVVAHDVVAHNNRAGTRPAPTKNKPTLGNIIGAFKSTTTDRYAQGVKTKNWPWFAGRLWQRNYYERIIRNNQELNRIRLYIQNNPANWETDRNNPKNFENQKIKN